MIASRERKTPEQATSDCYYLSKLLDGKLIVNIVVYADESGTHDLSSKQDGSKVAVLAGYAGMADDWVNFCGAWQTVLNDYRVKVFHFSEFVDKINRSKDTNWPYYGWSKEKRHDFLFKLASIAGSRARFPFAASFHLADYHAHPDAKIKLNEMGLTDQQINGPHLVYLGLFADFYEAFFKELKFHHPEFNETASFVFDRKDTDTYWRIAADDMFVEYQKRDSRLRGARFDSKFDSIQLQAADMIAYRIHQMRENEFKTKKDQVFTELDYILWGNFRGEEDFKNHIRRLLNRESKLESKKIQKTLNREPKEIVK